MSAGSADRHEDQPAYVLHSYPFRETSLVVQLFTLQYGRVAAVARGARRPRSQMRGVLMPFQPVRVGWGGKSELRTLHKAEWQGGVPQMSGRALVCGFYLNELLLKFLARDDPHEELYAVYDTAVGTLARGGDPEPALRRFEKHLLREIGYALILDRDADTGLPVESAGRYRYVPDRGPVAAPPDAAKNPLEFDGRTFIDMAADDYTDPATLVQAKALMRMLINHHLGDQALHTREIFRDLQQS